SPVVGPSCGVCGQLFYLLAGDGCGLHAAFPAPSSIRGGSIEKVSGVGAPRDCACLSQRNAVIASEAKQSRLPPRRQSGLLRRFAPRNDGSVCCLTCSMKTPPHQAARMLAMPPAMICITT